MNLLHVGDTLEFYTDKAGQHRWRWLANNGEIIGASSEGYSSEAAARQNFERPRSKDKVTVYQDNRGEWRWRATATNGNIVAAATEGYTSKQNALKNLERHGYHTDQIQTAEHKAA